MEPSKNSVGSSPAEKIRRTIVEAMRVRIPDARGSMMTIASDTSSNVHTSPDRRGSNSETVRSFTDFTRTGASCFTMDFQNNLANCAVDLIAKIRKDIFTNCQRHFHSFFEDYPDSNLDFTD